jgi:ABC-type transport system involved in cytochrome c biogenesis permease subunit
VLRNNYWLTVHVLTITLSYAAFALAWGLAHANLVNFAFRPTKKETQKRLSEFVYRALQIGVILLTAGTILGGVWANDSWGRFWGWDPKETWALIALLGYMIVLHGRSANWLGDFGTSLGSVIAFLGILMAWYGVNFVLGAGLHSYGFGGGGLAYIFAVILLDLLLVSYLAFCYNRARRLVLS